MGSGSSPNDATYPYAAFLNVCLMLSHTLGFRWLHLAWLRGVVRILARRLPSNVRGLLHSSISEQQSLAQNCFSCAGVFCVAQLVLLKGALQIVLKGASHLTDYVTKVMERLSDEGVDPKVVLAA